MRPLVPAFWALAALECCRLTLELSCEAPIAPGFVSFNSLSGGLVALSAMLGQAEPSVTLMITPSLCVRGTVLGRGHRRASSSFIREAMASLKSEAS